MKIVYELLERELRSMTNNDVVISLSHDDTSIEILLFNDQILKLVMKTDGLYLYEGEDVQKYNTIYEVSSHFNISEQVPRVLVKKDNIDLTQGEWTFSEVHSEMMKDINLVAFPETGRVMSVKKFLDTYTVCMTKGGYQEIQVPYEDDRYRNFVGLVVFSPNPEFFELETRRDYELDYGKIDESKVIK